MTEIRKVVRETLDEDAVDYWMTDKGPAPRDVAEVIVTDDRLRIEALPGHQVIFDAPLEILAWQLFVLEPDLQRAIRRFMPE